MKFALVTILLLALAPIAAADSWEEYDYTLHCSGCHRADGTGSNVVPSLYRIRDVFSATGVRTYLARVPGVAQAPLTDQRLANLLNWLIERFVGRPLSRPYTAKEVGLLRTNPLRDPLATRLQLLKAEPTSRVAK